MYIYKISKKPSSPCLQDDLLAELEELEQEALDEQLLEVGPAAGVELPSVPTAEPIAPKTGASLTSVFSVITTSFILPRCDQYEGSGRTVFVCVENLVSTLKVLQGKSYN